MAKKNQKAKAVTKTIIPEPEPEPEPAAPAGSVNGEIDSGGFMGAAYTALQRNEPASFGQIEQLVDEDTNVPVPQIDNFNNANFSSDNLDNNLDNNLDSNLNDSNNNFNNNTASLNDNNTNSLNDNSNSVKDTAEPMAWGNKSEVGSTNWGAEPQNGGDSSWGNETPHVNVYPEPSGNPYPSTNIPPPTNAATSNLYPQSGTKAAKNKRGDTGKNVQWGAVDSRQNSTTNLQPGVGNWESDSVTHAGKKSETQWGPELAWAGEQQPIQHNHKQKQKKHQSQQQQPAGPTPAWQSWGKELSGQRAAQGQSQPRETLANILNHDSMRYQGGKSIPNPAQFSGKSKQEMEQLYLKSVFEQNRLENLKQQQQFQRDQYKQHKQKPQQNNWGGSDNWGAQTQTNWGATNWDNKSDNNNNWGKQETNWGGGENGWNNDGGDAWNNDRDDAWNNNAGDGWDNGDEYYDEEYDDYDDQTVEDGWNDGQNAWNNNPRNDRRMPKSGSINPKDLHAKSQAYNSDPLSPHYDMPSKTLTHAYRGTDSKNKSFPVPSIQTFPIRSQMNDYADLKFVESKWKAMRPVESAFYSTERLARYRFHWKFSPDKDERVSSLLAWIQSVAYHLASFGLHKFLQTREKGALFANADFHPIERPEEPAFDWIIFDDLIGTKDRILQESVATYDPTTHVIVFVFLPSKTGKSVAIWRRKLVVPNNLRLAYQREISIAMQGLKAPKDYKVHLDELPAKSTSAAATKPGLPLVKSPAAQKAKSLNRTPHEKESDKIREKEALKRLKELQKREKELERDREKRQKALKKELEKKRNGIPAKYDKDGYPVIQERGWLARLFCV